MSLPAEQVLISADDHLDIHAMPPDVWSSGLPREWRERGPHVEETRRVTCENAARVYGFRV
jgi:hypothetical protein